MTFNTEISQRIAAWRRRLAIKTWILFAPTVGLFALAMILYGDRGEVIVGLLAALFFPVVLLEHWWWKKTMPRIRMALRFEPLRVPIELSLLSKTTEGSPIEVFIEGEPRRVLVRSIVSNGRFDRSSLPVSIPEASVWTFGPSKEPLVLEFSGSLFILRVSPSPRRPPLYLNTD